VVSDISVCVCVCLSVHLAATARRFSLRSKGNALYPVLSGCCLYTVGVTVPTRT